MKCTTILCALALFVFVANAQVANTNFGKVSGYTTATHKIYYNTTFLFIDFLIFFFLLNPLIIFTH